MPYIMGLEGPRYGVDGFWSDAWDGITSAASSAGSAASDAWSSIWGRQQAQRRRPLTPTVRPNVARAGGMHGAFTDTIASQKWLIIGSLVLGAWLAGSSTGQAFMKKRGLAGTKPRRRR